jgi:hypothetical protein
LQTGVVPLHAVESVSLHCTQDPAAGSGVFRHAGAETALQASGVPEPRLPSQGTQNPLDEQKGFVGSEHCVSLVHWTHCSPTQYGVGATHPVGSFVGMHCTQVLVPVSQYGFGETQLSSDEHPAVHWWTDLSQMPRFGALQSVFSMHSTHALFVGVALSSRHKGVVPVQPNAVVQGAHAPTGPSAADLMHAGRLSGQAGESPPPKLSAHGMHVSRAGGPSVVSQNGVVPVQAPVWLAVHWTHVSVAPLQTPVVPVHAVLALVVHWTHSPPKLFEPSAAWQAVVPALPKQKASVQGWHVYEGVPPPESHRGLCGSAVGSFLQLSSDVHATHTSAPPVVLQCNVPGRPAQSPSPVHCTHFC